jgi:hypothetical protein
VSVSWNILIGIAALALGASLLFLALCNFAYGWGYQHGHREGRRESNQFWLTMEKEVGEERVKIWREESELP